jgi:AcrR family transcriptional regulator
MAAAATAQPIRARRGARASTRDGGHAQIAQIQRARILSATFEVSAERGAANVSVAHIVARAGSSRRTFYDLFSDREDCFLAAFEDALATAAERVLPAYGSRGRWHERIRAALAALLSFLDEEPTVGRLLIADASAGGERALARREETIAERVRAMDEGRAESKGGAQLPPLTAEGAVGGALAILQRYIGRPQGESLLGLVNPLMSLLVMPYLGPAAARRELECPIERLSSVDHNPALHADPFKAAGMRLTYRTVCVLLAVAEHPGASNRLIGDTAEMKDQGQISKLLGRLERLGLVANSGLGPGQGAPNAWSLTESGEQMTKSIRAHTEHVSGEGAVPR